MLVVWRWLGPTAGWITAGLLAISQWSFSSDRMAYLWNPYAVALPSLLLVFLCARLVTTDRVGPLSVATLSCATFLIQTDISTVIVTLGLVAGPY